MIQTLSIAGIDELRRPGNRLENMQNFHSEIEKNLQCLENNLSIYLLSNQNPEQFTAYNPKDITNAKYYVKYALDHLTALHR